MPFSVFYANCLSVTQTVHFHFYATPVPLPIGKMAGVGGLVSKLERSALFYPGFSRVFPGLFVLTKEEASYANRHRSQLQQEVGAVTGPGYGLPAPSHWSARAWQRNLWPRNWM